MNISVFETDELGSSPSGATTMFRSVTAAQEILTLLVQVRILPSRLKREVTKVLSTGVLETSVSRFDSDLPDK